MKFILGKKLGMSQIFDKDGNVIPVTVIEAGPCFVTQVRDEKRDKYQAIQVGFERLKDRKVKKSQKNKPFRYLREFKGDISKYKVGDEINVSIFEQGDKIKASSISKGKGFQGVVKRHGFSGGPASHGHRHVLRTPGSIGSAFPEKVFKGKKMPGRAGGKRITIKNLKVALIDAENDLLAITGTIPGPNSSLVEIRTC
jgi:large subunit ribosomal protein L3